MSVAGKDRHRRDMVQQLALAGRGQADHLARPADVGGAQIAIAEQAGQCDLPDIGHRCQLRRRRLQYRHSARHLFGLAIEPALHMVVGRPVTVFVDNQQAGIEETVR